VHESGSIGCKVRGAIGEDGMLAEVGDEAAAGVSVSMYEELYRSVRVRLLPLEDVAADGDAERLAEAAEEGKHRDSKSEMFGSSGCLKLSLKGRKQPVSSH
jgi:hypothetical protein